MDFGMGGWVVNPEINPLRIPRNNYSQGESKVIQEFSTAQGVGLLTLPCPLPLFTSQVNIQALLNFKQSRILLNPAGLIYYLMTKYDSLSDT